MVRFRELPISPYLQGRLAAAEFVTPTEVQAAAIPHAICGKDILATAQTGTGKTLAFLVPIIEKLLAEKLSAKDLSAKDKDAGRRVSPLGQAQQVKGVRAIVLVPTRELAMQINKQYEQL